MNNASDVDRHLAEGLSLHALVPASRLQEIQDSFAVATGVASSLVRVMEPEHSPVTRRLTKESNGTEFCRKWVRASRNGLGKAHCFICDCCPQFWLVGKRRARKQCLRNGWVFTPKNCFTERKTRTGLVYIYRCHAGLWEFAAPIVVAGKHLATIYGGQVLIGEPTPEHLEHIIKLAQRLRRNPSRMLAAFMKVHRLPTASKLEEIARLLAAVATDIAEIGFERLVEIQQLRKLVSITNLIGKHKSAELSHSMQAVVERVASMLGAEACSIFLVHSEAGYESLKPDSLVVRATYGLPLAKIAKKPYRIGEGAIGQCAETGRPRRLRLPPSGHPKPWKAKYEALLKSKKLRNLLICPLRGRNQLLGVIAVANKQGHAEFDQLDERILASVGTQVGLDLENVWLREDEARTTADIEKTRRFLSNVMAERDPRRLQHLVVRDFAELVGADACTLFLLPSEFIKASDMEYVREHQLAEHFFIAANSKRTCIHNEPKTHFSEEMAIADQARFAYAPGEGLTGWVGKYGATLCIAHRDHAYLMAIFNRELKVDVLHFWMRIWGKNWETKFTQRFKHRYEWTKEPHWTHKTVEHPPRWKNAPYLAAPLVRGDKIVGVIRASGLKSSLEKRSFTARDKLMLTRCANHLVLALNSAGFIDDLRGSFAELASHDLPGPAQRATHRLDAIIRHWGKKGLDPTLIDEIKGCRTETHWLYCDATGLLRYLSVDADKDPLHRKPAILHKVLEEAIGACEGRASKKQVQIKIECPDGIKGAKASVDHLLIRHAIQNLITNGVAEASKRGGMVVCRMEDPGNGFYRISVENTGRRLENRYIRHAFDLGPGVRIVRRILEWHGGHCSASNIKRPNWGASFVIEIPTKHKEAHQ